MTATPTSPRSQEAFYHRRRINGPFVPGGTYCTGGWNFADIFFSDNGKITRFYDFAGTSIALTPVHILC